MKISNSKKHLARIISENGGWRDGAESAAQSSSDNAVSFYLDTASMFCDRWYGKHMIDGDIEQDGLISNWHQTVLSRAEYFHLYPAPDADGWIEWSGGECPVKVGTIVDVKQRGGDFGTYLHAGKKTFEPQSEGRGTAESWSHLDTGGDIIAYRPHKTEQAKPELFGSGMLTIPESEAKPTIEQLAADYRSSLDFALRKQQEADDAKAVVEAKLKALELAGEAIGLLASPITTKQETELVIADWRDLRVGDEVEYVEGSQSWSIGMVGVVQRTDDDDGGDMNVRLLFGEKGSGWPRKWRFIRRP